MGTRSCCAAKDWVRCAAGSSSDPVQAAERGGRLSLPVPSWGQDGSQGGQMSEHEPSELPLDAEDADVEAQLLKEALAAGAIAAGAFGATAQAMPIDPGGGGGQAVFVDPGTGVGGAQFANPGGGGGGAQVGDPSGGGGAAQIPMPGAGGGA